MMRAYDLVIRGGTIVDGTGVPQYKADLAVKNGRVATISGRIPAGAAREVDASGCIVAPGAIDLHTHYDAQLNWDPILHALWLVWRHLPHHRAMRIRFCPPPGPRTES